MRSFDRPPMVATDYLTIYASKTLSDPTLLELLMRAFILSLAIAALFGMTACGPPITSGEAGQAGATVSSGTADLGGPFSLVDHTGAVVTEAAFEGQPTLLYFGFSYCPDVCPTALQKLGRSQELMGGAGNEVQFVLVSVDPERDTPEQLTIYVTNDGFPTNLRGFSGTTAQIDGIKTAYKVFSQKVPLEGSKMDYTVDHQDIIFLLGNDGKFVDFFTNRSTPAEIAARTRLYLTKGL